MVAHELRTRGVDAKVCSGETSELMDAWTGAQDVIVVDAVVTGAPVGTVHCWDKPYSIKFGKSTGSTHGMGPAEAIELARAMRCLPSRLCVYGIEGQNFETGAAVSAQVQRAVQEVVEHIVSGLKING